MVVMNYTSLIPNVKTSGRLLLCCDGIALLPTFSLSKCLVLTLLLAVKSNMFVLLFQILKRSRDTVHLRGV